MSARRIRILWVLVSLGPVGFWVYYAALLRGPVGLDNWLWYPIALAGCIALVALGAWAMKPVTVAWVNNNATENYQKALDSQLHEHVLDMLTMVNQNLPPNITVFPEGIDVSDQRGEDQ